MASLNESRAHHFEWTEYSPTNDASVLNMNERWNRGWWSSTDNETRFVVFDYVDARTGVKNWFEIQLQKDSFLDNSVKKNQ